MHAVCSTQLVVSLLEMNSRIRPNLSLFILICFLTVVSAPDCVFMQHGQMPLSQVDTASSSIHHHGIASTENLHASDPAPMSEAACDLCCQGSNSTDYGSFANFIFQSDLVTSGLASYPHSVDFASAIPSSNRSRAPPINNA
ncbi:MAG: hypothetical protein COC19_03450 [SAR86 cluster bacterium]|uniref:DUF2946 domain-containing protein n=1 Tax=SAR86 cluster bacterium TaxID=2030880 RepID=A0A2A4MQ66_9GAMM|nr:MAG: hypothetical protein COC19_03450 [SAR86 cluster bacterium]